VFDNHFNSNKRTHMLLFVQKLSGFLILYVLQPLRWRCAEYVINHERDVREEQHHICVVRTRNN